MAEPAERRETTRPFPASRSVSIAASGARRQFSWLWGRESLLRLALSLALAIALWLFVTGKNNPNSIDFVQPIPVTTSSGIDETVTNTIPTVHVRYRTDSPNTIVTSNTFQAEISLLNRRPGVFRHIPISVLSTNPAVTVVSVTPAYTTVVLEPVISKTVPVVAQYLDRGLPSGYNAGTPTFTPNTIVVKGPKSVVSQVAQAQIDLNLAGSRTSILALFHPLPADSLGSAIPNSGRLTLSPNVIEVSVPIKAVASFKSLPVLVPLRGLPRSGYGVVRLTVTPSELTAKGSPGLLNHTSSVSTAPVYVSGRRAGTVVQQVAIALPRGLTSTVSRAKVTIVLQSVDAGTSTQVGVRIRNVMPGLVAHLRPGAVLVTVVGPSSSLSTVPSGVSAVVDLSGRGTGTYQFAPRVVAPHGFRLESVYPRTVTVSIVSAGAQ